MFRIVDFPDHADLFHGEVCEVFMSWALMLGFRQGLVDKLSFQMFHSFFPLLKDGEKLRVFFEHLFRNISYQGGWCLTRMSVYVIALAIACGLTQTITRSLGTRVKIVGAYEIDVRLGRLSGAKDTSCLSGKLAKVANN